MTKTASKKSLKKVCKAAESVAEVVKNTQLDVQFYFPCPIYLIERTDFLESVNLVSEEHLKKSRSSASLDEMYPVVMTDNFYDDPRTAEFTNFVGSTAWNILSGQGYNMQNKTTAFLEMWTQEHHKHSAMEQHVHGFGSQIVGFYFLETPENCSNVVFHDPRAGKVQISLDEQDLKAATAASSMIHFKPKPGMLMFANAWLAHSFTRHAADTPIKFVHFNLTTRHMETSACPIPPSAEVI